MASTRGIFYQQLYCFQVHYFIAYLTHITKPLHPCLHDEHNNRRLPVKDARSVS